MAQFKSENISSFIADQESLNLINCFEKTIKSYFNPNYSHTLVAKWIKTCLGTMLAIADEQSLYLLEFIDKKKLAKEIELLRNYCQANILFGETSITQQIEVELADYFNNKNFIFHTPIYLTGSHFQKDVWQQLIKIPGGTTLSYLNIAQQLHQPKAFRAAANANGANKMCIIIPCHRVINSNGKLGGYSSGLARKEWLLNHEVI